MLKSRLSTERTDRMLCWFSALGLGPNHWTMLALVPASAGFLALAGHHLAFGLVLFAASGFIDMVDGAVARATNSSTARGAFIDGVLDRYVELFLCLGLTLYLGPEAYLQLPISFWMVLMIFGSVMTSFVRAYADHRGVLKDPILQKRMGGLLERAERLMVLYLGMLLGIFDGRWLLWAIIMVAVLSNVTAVQRIIFAVRNGR
ncbi:Archaetidylinositol phosphate synthase [uncultured archaeon]|nr:Archaetidylinositol phosphate synthase [uncultured archaeon]